MLTCQHVRHVMSYNPETGLFVWVNPIGRRVKPGDLVGSTHRMGYMETSLLGQRILLHRLAWFYVHGKWPDGVIDHINGDKQDNRIANLRDVDQVINGLNRTSLNKNNKTGVRGVVFHKASGKFMARLQERYLGLFATLDDANVAIHKAIKATP